MANAKPIIDITIPASQSNVRKELQQVNDYAESILSDIAQANTDNEVVQARLGHSNLNQTLESYYNHLPVVTYTGMTHIPNDKLKFDKIVMYWRGKQVVKNNVSLTPSSPPPSPSLDPTIDTKIADTKNLGSTATLGHRINTSTTEHDLLSVVNNYLVKPLTQAELDAVLSSNLYTFEIGVGDRRNDSFALGRFAVATNWNGQDITDFPLTPEPYPADAYNYKLTFNRATKKIKLTDTHFVSNTYGAVRYFKIKRKTNLSPNYKYLAYDISSANFALVFGLDNNLIPISVIDSKGIYPAVSFWDYTFNHRYLTNDVNAFAYKADRSSLATPLICFNSSLNNLNLDMQGLDSRFAVDSYTQAMSLNNSVLKNMARVKQYYSGADVDFSFSGTGNNLHLVDDSKVGHPNTNNIFTRNSNFYVGYIMYAHTLPAGFLPLNGATVSASVYHHLYKYLVSAKIVSSGQTTFQLPDWRGLFIRVNNGGGTYDSGRVLGSVQGDQIKQHYHYIGSVSGYQKDNNNDYGIKSDSSSSRSGASYTSTTGGNETRPVNTSINAYIKT